MTKPAGTPKHPLQGPAEAPAGAAASEVDLPASTALDGPAEPSSSQPGQRSASGRGSSSKVVGSTKISARIPSDLADAARAAAGESGLGDLVRDALRDRLGKSPAPAQQPSSPSSLDPDSLARLAGLADQVARLQAQVEALTSMPAEFELLKRQVASTNMSTAQLVESTKEQLAQMRMMLAIFSKPLGLDGLDVFRNEFKKAMSTKGDKQ